MAMSRSTAPVLASLMCLLAATADAQSHIVVPTGNATIDGNAQNRIAGAGGDLRQQILVGEPHLLAMLGTSIEAIEWRRSASLEQFDGGAVQLTVSLSTSTTPSIDCSRVFANNIGAGETVVFSGAITIPTSPGIAGPSVAWTPTNVVRIELASPYFYSGGTLCIDITGEPISGQEPGWWMADAIGETQVGATTDLGGGCGIFGAGNFQSSIETRSLVAGGTVQMTARGTPFGLGIVVVGQKNVSGTPLSLLGFAGAAPNCAIHLSQILLLDAEIFMPDSEPNLAIMGARADFRLKIPAVPAALGAALTTQWLDWTQTATSNAIEWTIAPAMPSLDMALIEGHPLSSEGNATVNHAHVIRFEYQ